MRIGVFPGSFDPLTTAHLAIADAAIEACMLDHLDLTISTVTLAKEQGSHASIEARIAAIERTAATRPRPSMRTARPESTPTPSGPDSRRRALRHS